MYGSLDISTSGLIANRTWLDAISANIAGQHAIANAEGEYEPFRRRIVTFAAGDVAHNSEEGVHVGSIELDQGPLIMKYQPDSPFADADGNVGYPNINLATEQMNAMIAARSYEANIMAIEASKSMMTLALQILG
jgi:flagellar basal-body rod protein FlgC